MSERRKPSAAADGIGERVGSTAEVAVGASVVDHPAGVSNSGPVLAFALGGWLTPKLAISLRVAGMRVHLPNYYPASQSDQW